MTTITPAKAGEIIEAVITRGDLAALSAAERAKYYVRVCESVGLNPMTRPFEYITLNSKLVLYARRDAADQLRSIHGISIEIVAQTLADDLYSVHVRATDQNGRKDEDMGIVHLPESAKGETRANTILKAITKAKRRVTLSISGLGFLDETEVEDIPAAAKASPPAKRVTKKDSLPVYERMQEEVTAETTTRGLGEWKEANDAALVLLPLQWQLELSRLYEAHMADLTAIESGQAAPDVPVLERWSERQAEEWGAHAANGLAKAMRCGDADGGIPALRRQPEPEYT